MPNSLNDSPILQGLRSFRRWREDVAQSLHQLAELTGDLGLLPGGSILQLENLAFEVEQDNLRLAVVGEFSRGKTELINALLFADLGQRFLPSSTGQTTMCPVEIRGAPQGRAGLQLLPIASRSMDVSIEKLKRAGSAWVRLSFEEGGNQGQRLKVLTETICVAIEEARRLGLCPPLNRVAKGQESSVCPSCGLGKVLIPRWRHSMLFLPHPILDAGLTVLDTPGLNAIGAEPELTFSMLANADALLFILGIDTGVTHSDLTIWEQYLKRNRNQHQLVLLNKVDTLWDELRDPFEIEEEIEAQAQRTAERLGITREQVIPISGQKALLARIRGNEELLQRSGILELEKAIAELTIPGHRAALEQKSRTLAKRILTEQKALLAEQDHHLVTQTQNLQELKDRTGEKVPKLVRQHQQRLAHFEHDRGAFEGRKLAFQESVQEHLLAPLSTATFDLIISNAKGEMLSAWTTAGIVDRFRNFFAEAIRQFDLALAGAETVNGEISREYAALQQRYSLPALATIPYAILPRRAELLAMAESYERFGMMLEIAVNTQSSVVRKAFLTVAGKVRDYIVDTRRDAQNWVDEVMAVMNQYLESYHQKAAEELEALERISLAMDSIDGRVEHLLMQRSTTQQQVQKLERVSHLVQNALDAKAL
ncbi:dynamin family protein [Acidithiobacillus sp. AMEEHan]|uniref:dynamin family protein n=1 Tax=Acidithiobacillus sp. AMEEHan TaxID=2994951 RepID=UPI0027E573A9|nr:dynamin family protein [Acidithiobacillus sp. AMEEHan]